MSFTKEFKIDIAFPEMPVSGWTLRPMISLSGRYPVWDLLLQDFIDIGRVRLCTVLLSTLVVTLGSCSDRSLAQTLRGYRSRLSLSLAI